MLIRTARDAEAAACRWMQEHGFADARLTARGADGGIDVIATGAVAQVKAEAAPVGAPVVQQLFGAASARAASSLVFSLAGFTPAAHQFAKDAHVALFTFDLQSQVQPANQEAHGVAGRRAGYLPQSAVQRLSAAAATVGVLGAEMGAATPELGQRGWPLDLALWAATLTEKAGAATSSTDLPEPLSLDIAGSSVGIARIHLKAFMTATGGALVLIAVDGQLLAATGGVDGFKVNGSTSTALAAPNPDLIAQIVVGLAVEVLDRAGAAPWHMRVVGEPDRVKVARRAGGDPRLWVPQAEPQMLAASADRSLFSPARADWQQHERVTVVQADHVRWRQLRFDVSLSEGVRRDEVGIEVFAGTSWDAVTPGPELLTETVKLHLPDATVFPEPDGWHEDAEGPFPLGTFVTDERQGTTLLAVLADACSLLWDDLKVIRPD